MLIRAAMMVMTLSAVSILAAALHLGLLLEALTLLWLAIELSRLPLHPTWIVWLLLPQALDGTRLIGAALLLTHLVLRWGRQEPVLLSLYHQTTHLLKQWERKHSPSKKPCPPAPNSPSEESSW
jgi:hypothetical protein